MGVEFMREHPQACKIRERGRPSPNDRAQRPPRKAAAGRGGSSRNSFSWKTFVQPFRSFLKLQGQLGCSALPPPLFHSESTLNFPNGWPSWLPSYFPHLGVSSNKISASLILSRCLSSEAPGWHVVFHQDGQSQGVLTLRDTRVAWDHSEKGLFGCIFQSRRQRSESECELRVCLLLPQLSTRQLEIPTWANRHLLKVNIHS